MISRRVFLTSLGSIAPLFVISKAAHAAAISELAQTSTLDSLGEAILPSDLGSAGIAHAVDAFRRWMSEYRAGVELLHRYGTSALSYAGPTPATRWAAQLSQLDAAARRTRKRPFSSLGIAERQGMVRDALSGIDLSAMPPLAKAPHVAVALLTHFYGTPEAANLCYNAKIDRRTCRPLDAQRKRPLPIAKA